MPSYLSRFTPGTRLVLYKLVRLAFNVGTSPGWDLLPFDKKAGLVHKWFREGKIEHVSGVGYERDGQKYVKAQLRAASAGIKDAREDGTKLWDAFSTVRTSLANEKPLHAAIANAVYDSLTLSLPGDRLMLLHVPLEALRMEVLEHVLLGDLPKMPRAAQGAFGFERAFGGYLWPLPER